MVAREARRPRRVRRVLLWVTGVLVLALAAGTAAAYETGRLDQWFGDGDTPPPLVTPVPGFIPPTTPTPGVVARTAPSPRPTAACVRRAVKPEVGDPHLADLRAVVAPLTGDPVLDLGKGTSTPASTLKLLTATAALRVLGPDRTFATRVVAEGRRGIVLVGGGDPFLQNAQPTEGPGRHDASLQSLAAQTARRLHAEGARKIRVSYDTSLFAGPRVNPDWPKTYLPDVVSPITALWADEGLDPDGYGRVPDPPATAAGLFATYLRKRGIEVAPTITEEQARRGAQELARVTSRPVADIVERVLQYSDNEGAEVLAHQVGLAVDGDASYAGGVRGVRSTLRDLGIDLRDATIQDGSGLSRHDRLDAETLVDVLQLAASPDHPDLRSVITGLPVAAYDGSLAYRYGDRSEGRGLVRAKTGTLTGTSALAGITTDARHHTLVFAFVSNHIEKAETLDTRAALERLTTALATSRC